MKDKKASDATLILQRAAYWRRNEKTFSLVRFSQDQKSVWVNQNWKVSSAGKGSVKGTPVLLYRTLSLFKTM